MAGTYICYKNYADRGTIIATTGLTVDPLYPMTNLKSRSLGNFMKATTTAANPTFTIDLGTSRNIKVFAFLGIGGFVGAFGSSNDWLQIEFSSNNVSYTPFSGMSGVQDDAMRGDSSSVGASLLPRLFFWIPSAPQNVRYFRFTMKWPTGAGQIVQLARLWMSNAIVIPDGPDDTWSLGVNDSGSLDVSKGQQFYEDKGVRTRRLTVNFPVVSHVAAFGYDDLTPFAGAETMNFQEMQMMLGRTGECLILPRTQTLLDMLRLGIYGHLSEDLTIARLTGPNYQIGFTAIEER